MPRLLCACLLLIVATTAWSQVEPDATGGGGFQLDDLHMMTPPPVSGDVLPVGVGSEVHSNFLSAGLVTTIAYSDNLLEANTGGNNSDEIYSFLPTFGYDRRTPRQGEWLNYSSGFTFYQKDSPLNGASQNADAGYRFHISPYAVLQFHNVLSQNYNLFNQGNPFAGSGASGTLGSPSSVLVAPFANLFANASSAAIDYQYGRNAMIGGSGSYSFLHYSENSQTEGLVNGNTTGATGFFSRRLAKSEYVGVAYQFSKFITHPISTYTATHTVFGFYTHYFTRSFSASVLAGPEQYTSWSPGVPKQASWTPAVQGSVGWLDQRWNLSASFSHLVSGADGLIGAQNSNLGNLSAQLAVSKTWTVGANGEYAKISNIDPTVFAGNPAGHTVLGSAFLRHRLAERLNVEAGYGYFHESYQGITAVPTSPSSNRAYVSISYAYVRPVGR